MATTAYGVNHPLAVKLWSKKLFQEALKQCWAAKFMGQTSNSLIQIQNDTQKGPGDRVRVGLRMQLSGGGVQGDGTLEGNEEALTTYSADVLIDQLRHAVRSAGKMSEQRIPFSVREEARMGLQDWWADRLDLWFFNQLAGYTDQPDTRYTGNQAAAAPSQIVAGNSKTTEAALTNNVTDAIKFVDLDRAKYIALTRTPMIRPLKVNGEDKFVCFMHPYSIYQLRRDSSTAGNFVDLMKAAAQGGKIDDNPLYTGADFEYNGIIVHSSVRLPNITATPSAGAKTDYRRAVLCGAQAGLLAFGLDGGMDKMSWVEELFDYENQLGVSAGMIAGMVKTQFNSSDFGVITLAGYAPVIT